MTATRHSEPDLDVVIVGAGFSGLYLIYRLRQLGLSLKVIEAGKTVGGTWYWNRYPGARCDAISLEYSFSFSPELQQEWRWPELYSQQQDILTYMDHVADRFDLRRSIQFETRVVSARYDEASSVWRVTTNRGETLTARFCIMATGALSLPKVPDFPGLKAFKGEWYHTGNWPHEPVDFTGKRVGIIGTGSSGIQAIPVIAAQADRLTVFQRTPNFSVPAHNGPTDPEHEAWFKTNYDQLREQARSGRPVALGDAHSPTTPLEERTAIYEKLWATSGLQAYAAFPDLLVDQQSNDHFAEFVRGKIRTVVKDPVTAEKLVPRGFPLGTRRICVDTDYFETYNRANVELVDLREEPIAELGEHGIRTTAGDYPLDVLVFATGYTAMIGALLDIEIAGRGDESLADHWADGPKAYLGLMCAGFPNLFMINAPGSPSVLGNVVVHIEQHADYVCKLLERIAPRQGATIEPAAEAEERWARHVSDLASATLLANATSWYVWRKAPGEQGQVMPYMGGLAAFRTACEEVLANDLEGFRIADPGLKTMLG